MNTVSEHGGAGIEGPGPPAVAVVQREETPGLGEDAAMQRRRMLQVWAAAGSALAAMVAASWYGLARNGGHPAGGDMVVHAATARWMQESVAWWDWRGWSDWFYGGQAVGVNYPPLGHAWMRFTHPGHGQMAAAALGLLILLPWGTWRLARAVGLGPRGQRVAVGAVLVLVALSGGMHWQLPGFHAEFTGFGGWPAMLATVGGLFCAAWAAQCRRPLACGVVAGLAVLFNITVVPGVAVVCAALLATSGVSPARAARYAATAGCAALAVCAWWLVPFVAGWDRLVRWEVGLRQAYSAGGTWGIVVVTVVALGAAWAVRCGSLPSRRLAVAAAVALLAALVGDRFGFLRAERWLVLALLCTATALGGLATNRARGRPRPAVATGHLVAGVVAVATLGVIATGRHEVVPMAIWLLWPRRRFWVGAGALAWAGVLVFVPVWAQFRHSYADSSRLDPMQSVIAEAAPGARGLVYLDPSFRTAAGGAANCEWGAPWLSTGATGGRVRPLTGLYRETSAAAEFLEVENNLRTGQYSGPDAVRPHWFEPWVALDGPVLDSPEAAEVLGARWFVECDQQGEPRVTMLAGMAAGGVTVTPHASEEAWHRDATAWWIIAAAGLPDGGVSALPILSSGEAGGHPLDQAAGGVSLQADGDRLVVRAETAGWVWIRVPWDPDWRSIDGTPVRLGGPGHLVVWANEGATELHWSVPREVDVAAATTTGVAALATGVLLLPGLVERRRSREVAGDPAPNGAGLD